MEWCSILTLDAPAVTIAVTTPVVSFTLAAPSVTITLEECDPDMATQRFSPMVGTGVLMSMTFLDETGTAANPTTVTASVRAPDGTITTPAVTAVGVGLFTAEFVLTDAGTWVAQGKGEGAVIVLDEVQFDVRNNIIPE